MDDYRIFYDRATTIVAQMEELSKMLEDHEGLREYLNIYMDTCYVEEDEPLTITADFIFNRVFRIKEW